MKTLIASFLLLIMIFNTFAQSNPDSGLVARFPFNGNAIDETGNGHNGTVNGGVLTNDRFNQQNKAYTFPNLHNNIVLDNTTSMNLETGFTINAWVKYKNVNCGIVGKHNCWIINGFYFSIDNSQFRLLVANSVWSEVRTNENFVEDKWYMVTGVYDQTSGSGKVYVDGELKASGPVTYNNYSTAPITISEPSNGCPDGNMPGAVDEVKIYNRPLGDSEIMDEYNKTYSDLVLFLPFNGNANDESGNGNNGTVNGAALVQDRFGVDGQAYSFDGADDYITIADNPNLFSDELAISWWYKIPEYPFGEHVVIGWVDGGHRYQQFFSGNQLCYFNGYNLTAPGVLFNPTYNVSALNVWNHIVVTYKKLTSSTSTTSLYFDGELKQTDNHNLPMDYSPGISFFIGKNHNGNFFTGTLDDFRIYNRILDSSEIVDLYNDSTTYNPPLEDGLVAYWPLNGNTKDSTYNNNDGINYNGVFSKDRYGNDNGSMLHNGVDSYVEGINPGNNLPAGNSPRTFSAWIKGNNYNSTYGSNIFHYGDYNSSGPLAMHLATFYNLAFGNQYGFGGIVYGNSNIIDSTWHYISAVYENTDQSIKLFVDGVLDGSGILTISPNTQLNLNWRIGYYMGNVGTSFDGNIDELKVYNFALPDQQIWDMYKSTTTAPKLLFPGNDSTLINPYPTIILHWDSTVTANQYRLLIASDSLFNTIVKDTLTNTSSFDLYYEVFIYSDNLYWKVRTINDGGVGPWSEVNHFNFIYTDVKTEDQLPTEFALMQNYPNPFNPSTMISYQLPVSSNVTLKVFDVLGNEIATLVNEEMSAGIYKVNFNSYNLASGVYMYKIQAGEFVEMRKMILIR
jgi:hypothetical protein